MCVLGDYNQKIPRNTQPKKVAKELAKAIPENFRVITAGATDEDSKNLIDYFIVSSVLSAKKIKILSRFASNSTRLSDHVGVLAHIMYK